MSTSGRGPTLWTVGLTALAIAALVAVALIASGDDAPDVTLDGGEAERARVAWGEPEEGAPAGVVILLHGGGWHPNPAGFEQQKQAAEILNDQGYATANVGYGEGRTGVRQVYDVYEQVRKRYPELPICASGISAGGHLAMMLATRERDLACVVNFVGPFDLTTVKDQDEEGDEGYKEAVAAFGKDGLAKFSPSTYADRIKAKILMVLAETDPVTPVEQGAQLERAIPDAELLVLPDGPVEAWWGHGATVQPDAQALAAERIQSFLAESVQAG